MYTMFCILPKSYTLGISLYTHMFALYCGTFPLLFPYYFYSIYQYYIVIINHSLCNISNIIEAKALPGK